LGTPEIRKLQGTGKGPAARTLWMISEEKARPSEGGIRRRDRLVFVEGVAAGSGPRRLCLEMGEGGRTYTLEKRQERGKRESGKSLRERLELEGGTGQKKGAADLNQISCSKKRRRVRISADSGLFSKKKEEVPLRATQGGGGISSRPGGGKVALDHKKGQLMFSTKKTKKKRNARENITGQRRKPDCTAKRKKKMLRTKSLGKGGPESRALIGQGEKRSVFEEPGG